jgi:hypothetical protein
MIVRPCPSQEQPAAHGHRATALRWLPRRTGAVLVIALLAIVDMLAALAVLAVLGALVVPTLASG